MSLRALFCAVAAGLMSFAPLFAQQHVAPTDPLPPAEQQKKFKLPPGFEIQLVASEPAINKPMNLRFDHKGRLWVSHSVEYPFPANENPRDSVSLLEDNDQDGYFETATKVVEGLNIPIGVLPTRDGVIVHSLPNIYYCRDKDGDGKYETKEVLFGPFGTDDTHGNNSSFIRWVDGWYYATHGFRNDSRVKGADGHAIHLNSGNTYRFRANGSRIEHVSFGQVNPFGLCFDPLGNMYTADCHSMPIYHVLPGAFYPSFGKPHDGLGYGPQTIPHSHNSTALCGIHYYSDDVFPAEYRDTIFIGNVWTIALNHDRMSFRGSTPKGKELPDFLKCEDPWFRPVDIQLGPDGALYINDFYNRIIGHYEVPLTHPGRDRERGRIWRVVYRGTGDKPNPIPPRPDFTVLPLEELWKHVASANQTRRLMATHEICDRFGPEARATILKSLADGTANPHQRAHAAWILERTGGIELETLAKLAGDPDRMVRAHAAQVVAARPADHPEAESNRDLLWAMLAQAGKQIGEQDPTVVRFAAAGAGKHADRALAMYLIERWMHAPAEDEALIHTIRMSLRDMLLNPAAQAMMRELAAEKEEYRRRLLDVSRGARSEAGAKFVAEQLKTLPPQDAHWTDHLYLAARYLPEAELEQLAGILIAPNDAALLDRVSAGLRSAQRGLQERGKKLPDALQAEASRIALILLSSGNAGQRAQGVSLAKDLGLAGMFDALAAIARDKAGDEGLRQTAIEACMAMRAGAMLAPLDKLICDPDEPLKVRQKAAQVLVEQNTKEARTVLFAALGKVHSALATEIATLLARTAPNADALLAAIEQGQVTRQLLQENSVRQALNQANLPGMVARVTRLTAGLPVPDARLKALLAERRTGFIAAQPDAAAGKAHFAKHCAACHRIGQEGNKIGPELNGIGARGLERVLEDILDPNRNVDPAFRSVTLETKDGRVLSGLVLREEGEVLVFADAQGKEQRIPRIDIAERTMSPLSAMPANVAQLLKEDELYQLVAYLLAQRPQE